MFPGLFLMPMAFLRLYRYHHAILGTLEIYMMEVLKHAVIHMGEDDPVAVELVPVQHERVVIDVVLLYMAVFK